MLRAIRVLSIIIVLVCLVGCIVLLVLGSLAALLIIPLAIYLGYYLLILAFCNGIIQSTSSHKDTYAKIVAVFCFVPLILLLINPEGVTNFLMSGIHLDMK